MIPPAFLHELLARTDIVTVIGRHVELKKAGVNHKGLCPFHGEKTPSFTVSASKQFYHCFGCGAHGHAVRFLMEHAGLGFVDAVHELASQAGLTVPDDDRSPAQKAHDQAARERQATLGEMLAKAAAHYRKQLKTSARAIEYLKGRGLSGAIAARYGLGYAPDGWRGLASVFPSYDDPRLEECGLVIAHDEDGGERKRYDRFRDRIMFPILDVRGDIIGFGGRVLDRGEPKYLNSPETPLFVKGRELYGLYEARAAIRERGCVLVVEGYMDVAAVAQLGLPNAVATLGTACTADHVAKLFRFTDAVVFSFDGDAAGRKAAARALEAALPHASDTRTVRFLLLPPEHDPDSFVRQHGLTAFEQLLAQAVPLSRQLIAQAAADVDLATAEGRAHMLAGARPLWSQLPAGALKRQLLGELAAAALLDAAELGELWQPERSGSRGVAGLESRRPARASRWSPLRGAAATLLDRALWLLIEHCELWDKLPAPAQDMLAEQAAPYGQMFSHIERSLHERGAETAAVLRGELGGAEFGQQADEIMRRIAELHGYGAGPDPRLELEIVVQRLHLRVIEDELSAVFESGVVSPDADTRGRMLLQERARLKRELSQPAERRLAEPAKGT